VSERIDIRLEQALRYESTTLPPGTYVLRLDTAQGEIALSGPPAALRLKPLVRSSKVRVKRPEARLAQVRGERRRLLIVRIPPATEWVVSFDETEERRP
jgi:hypothetical protein